jgi:hypothetical protein
LPVEEKATEVMAVGEEETNNGKRREGGKEEDNEKMVRKE